MPVSKKRLKELAAMPDEQVDTSEILEVGAEFWEEGTVVYLEADTFSTQFDAVIAETRRQAKAAGLKKSDVTAAITRARKK